VQQDTNLGNGRIWAATNPWRPPAKVGSARSDGAGAGEDHRADAVGPLEPRTILVVDDDALVCAGTAVLLEDLGYVVVQANTGQEALDLLGADPRIDVVVTDHAMPGMNGPELAARILASFPDMPIILATGYAEPPVVNGNGVALPHIMKPFRQEELAAVIANVSGAGRAG
jgi:CheY-like chemotaxis protein